MHTQVENAGVKISAYHIFHPYAEAGRPDISIPVFLHLGIFTFCIDISTPTFSMPPNAPMLNAKFHTAIHYDVCGVFDQQTSMHYQFKLSLLIRVQLSSKSGGTNLEKKSGVTEPQLPKVGY